MRFQSKRLIGCVVSAVIAAGCLAEDPASFRSVDSLLPGLWVQDSPPPAPPTVDFRPDQSFVVYSSGVPGILVPDYHGSFWQAPGVIAFRGTGATEGVHVQFVLFSIREAPELTLTLTEITDAFMSETVGVENIDDLTADGVQSALRRLDSLPVPDTALGDSWDYSK